MIAGRARKNYFLVLYDKEDYPCGVFDNLKQISDFLNIKYETIMKSNSNGSWLKGKYKYMWFRKDEKNE